MVLIGPDEDTYEIPTDKILSYIDKHAHDAAVLLLPGIQYYTGQLFDIPRITRYAQERGLIVGWDLAHAYGNAEIKLHDWNVDFAAWCTYKYGNAGPGAMGGLFVNERHGKVDYSDGEDSPKFRHRLTGWYGGDRSVRFKMDNSESWVFYTLPRLTLRELGAMTYFDMTLMHAAEFKPIPGAGGWVLSNPSVIDLTTLCASLSVFDKTSMKDLRQKSFQLTAYLEFLLLNDSTDEDRQFQIITPSDPHARGAQLSLLLKPGLLHKVADRLQNAGIICDKREPDVVRVAPVPLYNTFSEVWQFVEVFKGALSS